MDPAAEAVAKAAAAEAVDFELQKKYNAAFFQYTRAIRLFLEIARDDSSVTDARRMAERCLERAKRLRDAGRVPRGLGTKAWPPFWSENEHVPVEPSPELSPQQIEQGAQLQSLRDFPVYRADVRLFGGDMQQGCVSDCSFITALEIVAEHNARWGTNLACNMLYPQQDGVPCASPDGTYKVKLYMHGSSRCIHINDMLPVSRDGLWLCTKPRHKTQLWPALLEKAYLVAKRSGYAFRGSHSSMDLYMLTGWIPEYIPMDEPTFQSEKTWMRLYESWRRGDCMVALSTNAAVDYADLEPLHCYGILALSAQGQDRIVTIINPWKTSDVSHRVTMSWADVRHAFDALLVNWNPSLYPEMQSIQGVWEAQSDSAVRLDDVRTAQTEQYHLLLQHVVDRPILLHLERDASICDEFDEQEYTALHVYPTLSSQRRADTETGGMMGVYMNTAHTLCTVEPQDCTQYTIAVSRHGTQIPMPYTLTAYATCPMEFRALPQAWSHRAVFHGTWRAPLHAAAPDEWYQPQYRLTVQEDTFLPRIQLMLTTVLTVPVRLTLCRSGERIHCLSTASKTSCTGNFSRGMVVSDIQALQPGTYTLLLSASQPHMHVGQSYALTVESSVPVHVEGLPAIGAGMYHRKAHSPASCVWKLDVPRRMPLMVCAAQDATGPLCVSITTHSHELATAHAFDDTHYVFLSTTPLEAGTYLLRVHGMAPVHVDMFGAQPVTLAPHSSELL